ncbi:partial putative ABC transporter phosphite binding protein PhnD1, partial [Planctomycetaceae bacterium]
MADATILLGAVAYDAKVVPIWEGIREHFKEAGAPMDFCLFSNYERQVESLLAGHIDIAWNTPLAHARCKKRTKGKSLSLGMRDSDRDFKARVIVRKDAGIKGVKDLEGKTLAVGSRDSTQARILPLHFLKAQGVNLDKVKLIPFDTDLGKHGDTGTSALD